MQGDITVGIPTYNNAGTLRGTISSVLEQTRRPVTIHIADNASSDDTPEIVRAFQATHPSIVYTRHPTNIGHVANFRFLLEAATTPYFMWLAADDHILPTYIEETAACLDARPDTSSCVSIVNFVADDGSLELATGSEPLIDDPSGNLAHYLNNPGANTRIYGLHRASALRASFPKIHFHAFDWALMAGTLLSGKHRQIPKPLMIRDYTPQISYVRQIQADNKTWLTRIFPLLPLTKDLVWRQRIPLTWRILRALLKINLYHHAIYTEQYYPAYSRMIGQRIKKHIWRLDNH